MERAPSGAQNESSRKTRTGWDLQAWTPRFPKPCCSLNAGKLSWLTGLSAFGPRVSGVWATLVSGLVVWFCWRFFLLSDPVVRPWPGSGLFGCAWLPRGPCVFLGWGAPTRELAFLCLHGLRPRTSVSGTPNLDRSLRDTTCALPACHDQTRGHHVPALTVTSGGRGVGSEVAFLDKSSSGRERRCILRRGRPDPLDRKRGHFGLRKYFTVGPLFLGRVFGVRLLSPACGCRFRSGLGHFWCLCPSLLALPLSNPGRKKGTDSKTGSNPKVTF